MFAESNLNAEVPPGMASASSQHVLTQLRMCVGSRTAHARFATSICFLTVRCEGGAQIQLRSTRIKHHRISLSKIPLLNMDWFCERHVLLNICDLEKVLSKMSAAHCRNFALHMSKNGFQTKCVKNQALSVTCQGEPLRAPMCICRRDTKKRNQGNARHNYNFACSIQLSIVRSQTRSARA